MKVYLDTSVVLAAYKPNDDGYQQARALLVEADVEKFGSAILVNELFSVVFRLYHASQISFPRYLTESPVTLSPEEQVYTFINAILLDWRITIPSYGYDLENLILTDLNVILPSFMAKACLLTQEVGLRTLDLLHLGAVDRINTVLKGIKYFTTLDQGILNKSLEIKNTIGIEVCLPKKLLHRQNDNST